jgi:hypothetical protein
LPRAKVILNTLCVCLSGCGLFEIGPASRIAETEPISFRVRVVEFGPHNPERVSYPSDAPVSEFLPGDRVRFEIEVADTDGLALADEKLDSVWLLLGIDSLLPLADPQLDLRCDELEIWTVRTACRLGEGRGSIEFEAPGLDEEVYPYEALAVYAVIAWNGQRAEDCWAARRNRTAVPSDCGFLRTYVPVGPPWWLLTYAESEGVIAKIPTSQFPAALFLQQANRTPILDHILVEHDGEASMLTASDGVVGPVVVDRGETVSLTIAVDENLQFAQTYFVPLNSLGDLFTVFPESVGARVSTAGPITLLSSDPIPIEVPIEVAIDDDAEPGIARVILAIHDNRGAESVVRVEFEVQ